MRTKMIKGKRKWREKNRFKVGFSTENPPHNQMRSSSPKYGITETKLVITVAPHKDICPQGRIYPKNAVAINTKNINIPDNQTFKLKYNP